MQTEEHGQRKNRSTQCCYAWRSRKSEELTCTPNSVIPHGAERGPFLWAANCSAAQAACCPPSKRRACALLSSKDLAVSLPGLLRGIYPLRGNPPPFGAGRHCSHLCSAGFPAELWGLPITVFPGRTPDKVRTFLPRAEARERSSGQLLSKIKTDQDSAAPSDGREAAAESIALLASASACRFCSRGICAKSQALKLSSKPQTVR